MSRTGYVPADLGFPLAGWGVRAVGAVADAVFIGVATYLLHLGAHVRTRTGYLYLDLAVSFAYSFALVGFWGRTLGMAFMRLDAVDAVEGRTPVGPARAAVRSVTAGALTVIPFAAFLDLLWPLWDERNQTLHDKAAGTVVLRH
ncbi:MAG: RDD family protein [Acidimicrobiales bacterium]